MVWGSRQCEGVALERVTRIDVGRLDKFERTPTGGLRIPARLTRVGVLSYTLPNGEVVRELRPAEEVFDAASIASFEDGAVTDLHPAANVTPETWGRDAVGSVRNVRRDGEFLVGDVLVQSARQIAKVEAGELREVSSGYTVELDRTPGTFEGEPYDVVQRQIRYNHAGLGPAGWGRAGPEVALRLDAAHELIKGADAPKQNTRSETMATVHLDGIDHEVGSTGHIQALEQRASKAAAERDELRGRHDAAVETIATLTKERDTARADAKEAGSQKNIDDAVTARVGLIDRARRVLGADFDGSGMSDGDVMVAALDSKGVKLDEEAAENGDYVRGRFEAITDAAGEEEEEEENFDADAEEEDPEEDPEEERGDSRKRNPKRRSPKRAAKRSRTSHRRDEGPPLTGLDKTRHDNREHAAKASSRFAFSK